MENILYSTAKNANLTQVKKINDNIIKPPKKKKKWYFIPLIILYVLMGLLTILVVTLFVLTTLYKPVLVDGSSMEPTLQSGDFLYMRKKATAKRGDIIVIHAQKNNEPILVIKRVIGLEGDRLFAKDGKLWRQSTAGGDAVDCGDIGENHDPNNFPFVADPFQEVTVAAGQVFVCGDNRANSLDSRTTDFGTLPLTNLEGVVTPWSIEHRATLKKITLIFNKKLIENGNQIKKKEYVYGESGYCKAI